MKIIISGLFAASGLMVLLPTPPAAACSCDTPTAEESLKNADAVFSGKVIARYDPKARARVHSSADPIIWTFAVDSVSKGKVARQQKVTSPRLSASCGVNFRLNAQYKVYARRVGNSLKTHLCSGTRFFVMPAESHIDSSVRLAASELSEQPVQLRERAGRALPLTPVKLVLDGTQVHSIQTCERNGSTLAQTRPQQGNGAQGAVDSQAAIAYYNQGLMRSDALFSIADYTQAIRANPKFDDAYVKRGNIRLVLRDCVGAIADYTQAIQINPNNAIAYVYRSRARLAMKDPQGARKDTLLAMQVKLTDATAYYNRGLAHAETENKSQAIADFAQAIRLNPNYVEAYFAQADAYLSVGDRQRAIEAYTQIVRLRPNDTKGYFHRGLSRFLVRDYPGAIADYTEAIQLNPNVTGFYYQRGVVNSLQGELPAAIEDFSEVIRLKSDFVEAYANRGHLRSRLGDKPGAIADFQTAAGIFARQGDQMNSQRFLDMIIKLQG